MKDSLRAALVLLAVFGGLALVAGLVLDFERSDVPRWLEAARGRRALVFVSVVGLLAAITVGIIEASFVHEAKK